jgi:hypothetical protein
MSEEDEDNSLKGILPLSSDSEWSSDVDHRQEKPNSIFLEQWIVSGHTDPPPLTRPQLRRLCDSHHYWTPLTRLTFRAFRCHDFSCDLYYSRLKVSIWTCRYTIGNSILQWSSILEGSAKKNHSGH